MRKLTLLFALTLLSAAAFAQAPKEKVVLVIHGGAGTILKKNMTAEKEELYRAKLTEALQTGYGVLSKKGSSLDAVVATIKVMENSPLFNAGKGAVFTNEAKNELDASIMDGNTRNCGSVAGVTILKNPIEAAKAVMLQSEHVMMAGKGAERFALSKGVESVDPSYFHTENRAKQLKKAQSKEAEGEGYLGNWEGRYYKFGTVGAVALDHRGDIVAGTSTGGMTNKRYGRVGDSPIIGAGTYADNGSCGVSCTGHGEYFIRNMVAYDIAALMKYKGLSVEKAAKQVVQKNLKKMGGTGGIIALDAQGNATMEFNTPGMYRGYVTEDGEVNVLIYKGE